MVGSLGVAEVLPLVTTCVVVAELLPPVAACVVVVELLPLVATCVVMVELLPLVVACVAMDELLPPMAGSPKLAKIYRGLPTSYAPPVGSLRGADTFNTPS